MSLCQHRVSRAIGSFQTSVVRVIFQATSFTHPILTKQEMNDGCKIVVDSGADTCVMGKHAHVIEFIDGKEVSAKSWSGHKTNSLRIANVAFAYDKPSGDTIILIFNQSIYAGDHVVDSLINPIQCLFNDVKVDIRPKLFYPEDESAQCIQFDDQIIGLEYKGPLPSFHVRRPTKEEFNTCEHYDMTSNNEWNPYDISCNISKVTGDIQNLSKSNEMSIQSDIYGIASFLTPMSPFSALDDFRYIKALYSAESDEPHFIDTESTLQAVQSKTRSILTPMELSKLWGIGLVTAKRTLKATTHRCVRKVGDLTRRFRTDKAHLRYRQLSTRHGRFYVDTLLSKVKSIRGFTCANLYTNDIGFRKLFPMEKESETPQSLQSFITLVGLPPAIHADNAKVFVQGDFSRKCKKYDIRQSFTEPHSPWMNRAETGIREIKSYGRKIMQREQAPLRLWCFAYEYAADICSLLATGLFDLGGRTPYEHVMQYTPDISEYVVFRWYQWAYYWDDTSKEKRICRFLGIASNVGQSMCFWILLSNGEYLARSTVIPIPDEDLNSKTIQEQMSTYTNNLHSAIGDHYKAVVKGETLSQDNIYFDAFYDTPNEDDITWPWEKELEDLPLHEESTESLEELDQYIGVQIVLPSKEGVPVLSKVIGRKRDYNDRPIGKSNDNPILDTRVYEVQFPDGHVTEYATNKIAEALYAQVDEDGFDSGIVREIIDHQKTDAAIPISQGYVGEGPSKKPKITTKGWKLKVLWKDGSTDWLPLSQVKESNPIEVAEYSFAQSINKEPAFNWWVSHVIRKRDRMINKVISRTRKSNMKFGLKIPQTVAEAYEIDRENGNNLWATAIEKEMTSIKEFGTFDILDNDQRIPVGYQEITCHMIFDIKFNDLRRKARYVAGGHLVDKQPSYNTYSSVVSRESVRIAFLIAALNDLDVTAGDISNAYLHAKTKEKVWFRAGPEFGQNEGARIIIVKALYGLPGSGNAWRTTLADTLRCKMGYRSSLADPDVWYKPQTKKNGDKYYSYILVYTDDLLCVHENPTGIINNLKEKYPIKPDSIGPPRIYLGANVQKIDSKSDGVQCWGFSAERYVREAVRNVKERMKKDGFTFNKKLSDKNDSPQSPFSHTKYRPELDSSYECTDEQANYFQSLIGVLRWIIELGRIDINFEVSALSQYCVNPRIGHLVQAIHIFKYLDIHKENFLAFDPTYLDMGTPSNYAESSEAKAVIMKDFYPDACEKIPPNAPLPRGKPVQINCFVDADHAGNIVTRRSQTGILIFLNMAPISWYSKRQNTVESSTFSSEFIALKTACEQLVSLRYKLRMFGIPLNGPANIFCDNEAVYRNTSDPSSTLKKRHQSIAYHTCRESVASGMALIFKEAGETNLSDILTKSTHTKERRRFLRECIMRDVKVE